MPPQADELSTSKPDLAFAPANKRELQRRSTQKKKAEHGKYAEEAGAAFDELEKRQEPGEEFAFDEPGPTQVGPSEAEAKRLAEEDERYVAGLPSHKQQSARAARRAARKGGVTLEPPQYDDPTLPEAPDEPAAEAAVEKPGFMAEWQVKDGTTYYRPEGDPYRYSKDAEGTFTAYDGTTGEPVMTVPKGHANYADFEAHFRGDPTEFTRGKAAPPAPPASDAATDEEQAGYADLQAHLGGLDAYAPELGEEPAEAPAEAPAEGPGEGEDWQLYNYPEAISPGYSAATGASITQPDVGGARSMARMLYDASEERGGLSEADLRAHAEGAYPVAQQEQAFQMLKRTAIDVDELKDLSAKGEWRSPAENTRLMDLQMYYMMRGGGEEGESRQYVLPEGRASGAQLSVPGLTTLMRSPASPLATRAVREAFRPSTREQREMLIRGPEGAEGQELAPAPAEASPAPAPAPPPRPAPAPAPAPEPAEAPSGLTLVERTKLATARAMMTSEEKENLRAAQAAPRSMAIPLVLAELRKKNPGATEEDAILLLEHG